MFYKINYKNPTKRVGLVHSHDIAEKLPIWR